MLHTRVWKGSAGPNMKIHTDLQHINVGFTATFLVSHISWPFAANSKGNFSEVQGVLRSLKKTQDNRIGEIDTKKGSLE